MASRSEAVGPEPAGEGRGGGSRRAMVSPARKQEASSYIDL